MKRRIWSGVARRARAMPSRFVHHIAEGFPIAPIRARGYRAALRRHEDTVPDLAGEWAVITQQLGAQGVAQTQLRSLALEGSDALLETAQALVGTWKDTLRQKGRAGAKFLTIPSDEIASHGSIYEFGLRPELLALAEAYIGLPVAYDGVCIQYTLADGLAVSTREWHRDREDRRMLKMAIYLNDVDSTGGPFELLPYAPGTAHDGVPERGFHLSGDTSSALDASAVQPWVSCEGDRGTVVFADTAQYFHRGRPATGRDRAAIFFSYFARVPQRPYFCQRTGLSRQQISSLVSSLKPNQQAAALWQTTLPWWWRVIPPAAV